MIIDILNEIANCSDLASQKRITQINKNTYDNIYIYSLRAPEFMTGFSNNHCCNIGDGVDKVIKKKLEEIDKISKKKGIRNRNRAIKKRKNKLSNLINELHWKTSNYLTSKYGEILVGNFSTKSMGQTNINKMVKRVGSKLKFYKFKQRLQYKCMLKGVKYGHVIERYTSKLCTRCGIYYNVNLGGDKIYKCNLCRKSMDRDINGARNIYIKGIK